MVILHASQLEILLASANTEHKNARLLVYDPQGACAPPTIPNLVIDNAGAIIICGDSWALPVQKTTLESVTVEDLRIPLRLRPDEKPFMYLSSIRALPDQNMHTPAMLTWLEDWWLEVVAVLQSEGRNFEVTAVKELVTSIS